MQLTWHVQRMWLVVNTTERGVWRVAVWCSAGQQQVLLLLQGLGTGCSVGCVVLKRASG